MSEGSDEIESKEPDAEDNEPSLFDVKEGNDWFLAYLVHWANDLGFEVGITLNMGGTLVSGTIINGAKYFKEFATAYASVLGSDSSLREPLEKIMGQFAEIYELPEDAPKLQGHPPSFIHLKDAKSYHPGSPPIPTTGPGTLWRGRISSVDGFSLGSLTTG